VLRVRVEGVCIRAQGLQTFLARSEDGLIINVLSRARIPVVFVELMLNAV
jgi:hypothetical protein